MRSRKNMMKKIKILDVKHRVAVQVVQVYSLSLVVNLHHQLQKLKQYNQAH